MASPGPPQGYYDPPPPWENTDGGGGGGGGGESWRGFDSSPVPPNEWNAEWSGNGPSDPSYGGPDTHVSVSNIVSDQNQWHDSDDERGGGIRGKATAAATVLGEAARACVILPLNTVGAPLKPCLRPFRSTGLPLLSVARDAPLVATATLALSVGQAVLLPLACGAMVLIATAILQAKAGHDVAAVVAGLRTLGAFGDASDSFVASGDGSAFADLVATTLAKLHQLLLKALSVSTYMFASPNSDDLRMSAHSTKSIPFMVASTGVGLALVVSLVTGIAVRATSASVASSSTTKTRRRLLERSLTSASVGGSVGGSVGDGQGGHGREDSHEGDSGEPISMAKVPSSVYFKVVKFVADVCRYAAAAWVTQAVLHALAGPLADAELGGGGGGGGVGGGVGGLKEAVANGIPDASVGGIADADMAAGADGAAGSAAKSVGATLASLGMRWVTVTLPFGEIVTDIWCILLSLVSAVLDMVPLEGAHAAAERVSEAGLDLAVSKTLTFKMGWGVALGGVLALVLYAESALAPNPTAAPRASGGGVDKDVVAEAETRGYLRRILLGQVTEGAVMAEATHRNVGSVFSERALATNRNGGDGARWRRVARRDQRRSVTEAARAAAASAQGLVHSTARHTMRALLTIVWAVWRFGLGSGMIATNVCLVALLAPKLMDGSIAANLAAAGTEAASGAALAEGVVLAGSTALQVLGVAGLAGLLQSALISLIGVMQSLRRLQPRAEALAPVLQGNRHADAKSRNVGGSGWRTEGPTPDDGLRTEDLWVSHPGSDAVAIKGVALHAAGGSVLAVVGGPGSGKTTLMRALAGDPSVVVTGGRVVFQGRDQNQVRSHDNQAQVHFARTRPQTHVHS